MWKTPRKSTIKSFFSRKIPQKWINRFSNEAVPLIIASILVGIISVLYEVMFSWVEKLAFTYYKFNPYIFLLTSPICFITGVFLVRNYAPFTNGSGIPQLLAAIELAENTSKSLLNKLLGLKTIIIKIGSSLVMLLGGGSIGREGPTLQISGAVFNWVNGLFANQKKFDLQTMLITSGASGLAAAFNTPLGGIVYVVEELSKTHINKLRVPVFTAVIFAGFTAQFFMGPYLFLGFPKTASLPLKLLPLGFGLAILGGLMGSFISLLILKTFELKKKISNPYIFAAMLGFFFAILIIYTNQNTLGSGKPLINKILFEKNIDLPWYTFPSRFIGSWLSFSSGSSGGIFATSLSAGAALGHTVTSFFDFASSHNNLLVLMTMIAFLTGVTRTPFTASILVLEMTDRHSAIFYFLMASIIAQFASERVMKVPFYEILKNKIISENHKKNIALQID